MSNVLSKESGMSEQLNKCEAERKYLHKVYEELKARNKINQEDIKQLEELRESVRKELGCEADPTHESVIGEIKKLKEELKTMKKQFNSLMTEEQKDICNGEAMELGEPTLQTPQDWVDRIRMFLEERDSLAQAVEDLEEEEGRLELENKKLKETNQLRFDKIKEMENEVGVSKLVHHQNVGLLEDIKKLKDCNYEEYCELVGENKLVKEFEDLKNELGELKEQNKTWEDIHSGDMKIVKMLKEKWNEEQEKNKGLRNGGGDYISREEHQKVADFLNAEAEKYKVKFMEATGQLK